ncbi:MAG TPA: glycoside hydrolase family 28 protein [Chitinophagaceae bacterium]|nr:glycoside hydrolase family 28 protein [Chitinophagaceae bacterium]
MMLLLATAAFFTACSNKPSAVQQIDQARQGHLPEVIKPDFKSDTFNIIRYGAKSDGITLNTKSINAAIMDCSKNGGGVVLVPDGFWLTGPLVLQNNVNLHIQRGALLQFTADFDRYPLIESNYEGLKAVRCQSPISGKGLENIAITGAGVIDGSGGAWRMVKKGKVTASQWDQLLASGGVVSKDGKTWYPSAESFKGSQTKHPGVMEDGKTIKDYEDIKDFLRPNLLSLFHCKKVLLQGVTFQNSPAWCLHPLLCENLTVDGIYAKNPWYAQNGDGIDVESCRNVVIENSTFDVGDDGICMKSGRDEEGRKRNAPTENVLVRNCIVYHAHGGFVIGSEMSGGVRNVYVSDCSFIGTDVGLRFKTTRGRGGVVENIHASHINMRHIAGDAIRFDMYYAAKDPVPLAGEKRQAPRVETLPVTEGTPQFRNFHISNIFCNGARRAIFIRGLPEMNIKDIYFDSMVLKTNSGMECLEADSIYLHHVKLLSSDSGAVITLQNSKNIAFREVITDQQAPHFMDVMGADSKNIMVGDSTIPGIKDKIRFTDGATPEALQINKTN